ncbi:hypothetical protein Hanom_Chr04g00313981 [Helianthus anomalus]
MIIKSYLLLFIFTILLNYKYIYCSSAGVYLKSDLLSHCEIDVVDPKSQHKGKLESEDLLESKGLLNYNPVEEWFFNRMKADRTIPIPNSGLQLTQLGHVKVSNYKNRR